MPHFRINAAWFFFVAGLCATKVQLEVTGKCRPCGIRGITPNSPNNDVLRTPEKPTTTPTPQSAAKIKHQLSSRVLQDISDFDEVSAQLAAEAIKQRQLLLLPAVHLSNINGSISKTRVKRLVNGRAALENEWCWQVVLFSRHGIIGSGALISPTHIVTAAHVVERQRLDEFLVLVGKTDILDSKASNAQNSTGYYARPKSVRIHPRYNSFTLDDNIAVIEIPNAPCDTQPNVCTICFEQRAVPNYRYWNETCYYSGWGRTAHEKFTNQLRTSQSRIIPNWDCNVMLYEAGVKIDYAIPQNMICAMGVGENAGSTCERDGGAPLTCYDAEAQRWQLRGITALGIVDCRKYPRAPALFVNIGRYYDWIKANVDGTVNEYEMQTFLPQESPLLLPAPWKSTDRHQLQQLALSATIDAHDGNTIDDQPKLNVTILPT